MISPYIAPHIAPPPGYAIMGMGKEHHAPRVQKRGLYCAAPRGDRWLPFGPNNDISETCSKHWYAMGMTVETGYNPDVWVHFLGAPAPMEPRKFLSDPNANWWYASQNFMGFRAFRNRASIEIHFDPGGLRFPTFPTDETPVFLCI
jgi:hypothetical protein